MSESLETHRAKHLIRTTYRERDAVDEAEICRLIEYLGGLPTDDGFAFPSAERRAIALEVLAEKYGQRFATADD